jgi:hypothetical protein
MIGPGQKLSNPHDSFFKELFSRPEVAADFLNQTTQVWDRWSLSTFNCELSTVF